MSLNLSTQGEKEPLQTLTLPLRKMSCAGCAARIERALAAEEGVLQAGVNFATESAQLTYDPRVFSPGQAAEVVRRTGYEVPVEVLSLRVTPLTCASCARRVENALRQVPGVISAQVNATTELAQVATFAGPNGINALFEAVGAAGYRASRTRTSAQERKERELAEANEARRELMGLLVAGLLSFPLVLPMLLHPFGIGISVPGAVQFALALVVQALFAGRFYTGAVRAVRAKSANMDVLVALGTSAALLLSTAHLFRGGHLYFESSAVVITLVRFGKWLESRAKHSAASALRSLTEMRPETARVELDGGEVEVPAETLGPGTVVLVRPGERVPCDGEIVEGESEFDESLLTGENLPVSRGVGESVLGASLNGSGFLRVRTTRVGEQSTLSRLVALVESAQGSKAPVERLVDQISAVFVPVVLALAGLTFASHWFFGSTFDSGLIASVSVLVIACPCALGLATPAALTVATTVAARSGILIRDAASLERTRAVSTVIFDKTGTLTQGQLTVFAARSASDKSTSGTDEVLSLACALARGSEHPIARALLSAGEARGLEAIKAEGFKSHPGRGTEATVKGRSLFLGSPRFRKEKVHDTCALDPEAEELQTQGKTVVWLFHEAGVLGCVALGDELRAGAKGAVQTLRQRGIETVLLTGDNEAAARVVGEALGVDRIVSEVLPEGKVAEVLALKKAGRVVAMVGDGINDAPALAAADVGFAMSSGSDVAVHAAGITLMRPDPVLVLVAMDLSARAVRKIRQNLFWAFAYNVVGIPLAAFGVLTPMFAGAAMALSSVSVLVNALHLRTFRPITPAGAAQ